MRAHDANTLTTMACPEDMDLEALMGERSNQAPQVLRDHVDSCRRCRERMRMVRENLESVALIRRAVEDGLVATMRGTAEVPASSRYQVEGEIGRGGMGVVYRAWQRRPRRTVALKVMQAHVADGERARALFEIEAQALARLVHPGIATVFDAGYTDGGEPFIAMEFVQGEPLDRHLSRVRPDRARRIRLAIEMCRAVGHAHSRGVRHGDLKPQNILIADGSPKVVDFGLARVRELDAGSDGRERAIAASLGGTIAYMSPEQARGERDAVDITSDVYALGVVLHEMLCGSPPWARPSSAAEALALVRAPPPPDLGRRGDPVPPDLAAILSRALATAPCDRYANANELADDLARFVERRPVAARRIGPIERGAKFCRRNAWLVAAAAATVAATLAGVAGVAWQARRTEDARQVAERRLDVLVTRADLLVNNVVAHLNETLGAQEVTLRLLEDLRRFFDEVAPQLPERYDVQRGHFETLRALANTVANRGDEVGGLELMRASHALVVRAIADHDGQPGVRFQHAYSLLILSSHERANGLAEAAESHLAEAVDQLREVVERDAGNAECRRILVRGLERASADARRRGDAGRADALLDEASAHVGHAIAQSPDDVGARRSEAEHQAVRARLLLRDGGRHDATELQRSVVATYESLLGAAPDSRPLILDLADARFDLASALAGDPAAEAEARHLLAEVVQALDRLARADPGYVTYARRKARAQELVGRIDRH